MTKWMIDDLNITVDSVLRGQGADPDVIRSRNSSLVEIAGKALAGAKDLLEPEVYIKEYKVTGFQHNSLELEGGQRVTGPLVSEHLTGASYIAVAVSTIGSKIDDYASEVMSDDIVFALAVEGVGSAAVESLANEVCRQIEIKAGAEGMQTTIPLSPGMIGWNVEEGQKTIFELVDPAKTSVSLTPYYLMVPRKSLSMMIGVGPNISSGKRICDYCTIRESCQYQDHNKEIQ